MLNSAMVVMFMSVQSVWCILNSAMLFMFMSVENVKHKVY